MKNLFDNVWNLHKVKTLDSGMDQLFIGLHLIHEVTSPQAFGMLKEKGLKVRYPERTFATVDHIIPTDSRQRPFQDDLAEAMIAELEQNTAENNITFFGPGSGKQGIVHMVGPERGLTQPGMTVACGDSHTATHGAFGAIAFGIGTSQIRDVLATGCLVMEKPKVRKINITGTLQPGVYAKDIILKIMADLGVNGGIGYAYEYGGPTISALSMEERMTICNMSIEGGARAGYICPDQTTIDYLKGREYVPRENFAETAASWLSLASPPDATYDDVYNLDVSDLAPMVTWGINPGQAISLDQTIPAVSDLPEDKRLVAENALEHMDFSEGDTMTDKPIDVVFIGSCTNGRISDLREAAALVKGREKAPQVKAIVVPGSEETARQAETEGLDKIFTDAGFEWRHAGCSMCLAMNPDKLTGRQICASSSNRNFIGRQGSPTGRTLLMSPAMAAAAALKGAVADVRRMK